ncbi:MAG: methylated-DNA--[protein]-cysteine S-methyltransferase [Phycisphaerales bacterium]|nr:methylated-DNA--[protein]-cysteine S-methyltransferase [Phycisphaerales bacterium]
MKSRTHPTSPRAELTLPSPQKMYRALLNRDAAFDGLFFIAVKTTGIFCRCICPARKPKRRNVEFFPTAHQALLAGYRPCKRCRPLDFHQGVSGVSGSSGSSGGATPQWVRNLFQRIERAPTTRIRSADLRAMSIEPARAARFFKRNYGMTFQAYHRARRLGLAFSAVRSRASNESVDLAALRHGYNSTSGFRDAFTRAFGIPPGRARAGAARFSDPVPGAPESPCMLARWLDTPLGAMLAIANDEGLCLLEFVDRRMLETELEALRRRLGAAILPGDNRHLAQIAIELARYFDGSLRKFAVPLVLRGSPFQLKVWRRLMSIPYGQTNSYSQMAADLGIASAQRAVGRANGDNRLAIIIPCHRVIRADGSLCGYGGGLHRKQWLLNHERGHANS